ncbi:MaoC/PaaZ C-terminal domain-containing protein [Lignipirellula cremea]|uniref:Bifunctional protein PaaZ n=1 Tax=Lignipirellula cremea TaxID=2528010 RepID=A0A518E1N6_9BACT|nr:MaoC/PaaZ C-terminal domain-containing protein [Lignipirellula cremea]QDU97982.1 Bifunctional protein PaaZ [Lignipirellula cremea]
MAESLHYDDLELGDVWESRGRTITETDVVNFGTLTGDTDPLHMDVEFAQTTPFRQRIAHGLLGLSLAAGLASECPRVKTDAFSQISEWSFLKPIYFGDTVRVITEVVDKRDSGRRRGQVTWRRRLVNQRNETVQEGLFDTVVSMSPIALMNRRRAA